MPPRAPAPVAGLCVAVAVSGGVDSLHALLRLHATPGLRVMAIHGRFLPAAELERDPVPPLRELCAARGIPFHCLDCTGTFAARVITPFLRAYAAGHTPNPCALCNAQVKFGALWEAARALGANQLATGHYARLAHAADGTPELYRANDPAKDQSYFLALVPRERLVGVRFPLAAISKSEVVRWLAGQGVDVPLPGESQEICFVPQDAYRPFVERECARRGIALGGPGEALLNAGQPGERCLGRHGGLWRYTEGQRRGLGLAWSEPLYVQGKDMARNVLKLCTKADLAVHGVRVEQLNMLVPRCQWPDALLARVRYKQQPVPAIVREEAPERPGSLTLTFATPQAPTAPGQVAALYDAAGRVLAGGIIAEIC